MTLFRAIVVAASLGSWAGSFAGPSATQSWLTEFDTDPQDLATVGRNTYFILEPGYQLRLEGRESGKPATLVVTVLDETTNVGGIETRVVEERETLGGQLAEVSRNYFAISRRTKDVYYFGEDVDVYRRGVVVDHEGAWRHGTNNARFGLMMPGKPTIGLRYYQEQAKGVAMDRAEIVSVSETMTVAAGSFTNCLKTRETTPLEPLAREYKMYAPDVGLIMDGALTLGSHTARRP